MPNSKDLYVLSFDKAIPIIVEYGKKKYTPLPLCVMCHQDYASHLDGVLSNLCESCYNTEIEKIMNEIMSKRKRNIPRNNKICSTCSLRKACIKNGRKLKTCEECLLRKKEEYIAEKNRNEII